MRIKSFSQKIVSYMLILMIISFIVTGICYSVSIYKNLSLSALQKAEVQIEHTKDTINTNFNVLKLLVYKILGNRDLIRILDNDTLSTVDLRNAEQYLSNDVYSNYCWTNGVINAVYVFKDKNTYIRATRAPYYNQEIDRNREIFEKNFNKYGIEISPPSEDNRMFYFSVSFEKNNDTSVGYVVITVNADKLCDTLNNVGMDSSNVYVVDGNNRIYASSLKEEIGKVLRSKNIYRKEALDSQNGLYTVTEILYSNIVAKFRNSLVVYIMVFFVVILIAFLIALFIMKNLTEPLKNLVAVIKEFEGGNWDIRVPVYNDDEIDKIGTAFNSMCKKMDNLVNTVYKNEFLIKDAKLQALRAQINPHFLFNTLTTIATIAKKDKNEQVSSMIRMLSKLLRERVITDNDDFATLKSELLLVDYYFYIQKVRFKDHIHYEINKDENVPDNCCIPKLLLQPIVENAVCHGLEESVCGGTVTVNLKNNDRYIIIEICDDGVGFDITQKPKEGDHKHIMLLNIRKRLEIYYESDFVFEITSKIGVGTKVYIKFPINFTDMDTSNELT